MFRSRAQNWCTDRVETPALISLLVTLLIIFNSLAQPRASGVPNILLSGYQSSYIAVLRVEMLLVQATATSYPRWHTSGRQFRRQSRPQRRVGLGGIGNRNFSLIILSPTVDQIQNIFGRYLLSSLWQSNFTVHNQTVVIVTLGGSNVGYFWEIQHYALGSRE